MAVKRKKNRYKARVKKKPAITKKTLAWWAGSLVFAGGLILFGALAILVHDFFTQSQSFSAKTITVAGNARLEKDAVLACAGIEKGENILSVRLGAVHERLIAHPWVKAARVSRDLPGTIHIEIKERRPVAVAHMGEQFLMDEDGCLFKRFDPKEGVIAPVVMGLNFSDVSVSGKDVSPLTRSVLKFLACLDEKAALKIGGMGRVASIHADRDMGLTVVAQNPGCTMRLGFDSYGKKLRRLEKVWAQMRKRNLKEAKTIDCIRADRIVVKTQEMHAGAFQQRGRTKKA